MAKAEPVQQTSWGIIRYAAGSGRSPDEDAAAFDGWYFKRAEALAVAEEWARTFPQWIVALVGSDQIWFGDGDFSTLAGKPLTFRERALLDGQNRT
jgi:hypothetical protein